MARNDRDVVNGAGKDTVQVSTERKARTIKYNVLIVTVEFWRRNHQYIFATTFRNHAVMVIQYLCSS